MRCQSISNSPKTFQKSKNILIFLVLVLNFSSNILVKFDFHVKIIEFLVFVVKVYNKLMIAHFSLKIMNIYGYDVRTGWNKIPFKKHQ